MPCNHKLRYYFERLGQHRLNSEPAAASKKKRQDQITGKSSIVFIDLPLQRVVQDIGLGVHFCVDTIEHNFAFPISIDED